MDSLNKKQLAFLLDIKAEDARAKMCVAWSTEKGINNEAEWNAKDKIDDPYPNDMPIELLSRQLKIPTLQEMVNDIQFNYLKRPAAKKWILFDYPEKHIAKCNKAGTIKRLNIPSGLRSFLPSKIVNEIKSQWQKNYPKYVSRNDHPHP